MKLTAHSCILLDYCSILITFLYMFRTMLRSSSGGQIVLVQHLVSSLSLGDCSVHRLNKTCRIKQLTPTYNSIRVNGNNAKSERRKITAIRYSPLSTCVLNSHLKRVTIPDAVLIQFDLLRMSTIMLETCRRM
jgi:hypothetical protein